MRSSTEVILSGDWAAIKALLEKAPLLHIRRFAVFCARDALATARCSDLRLHMAVLTIARYIEGEATAEEFAKAKQVAENAAAHAANAAYAAGYATTVYAAYAAAYAAADAAAHAAARAAYAADAAYTADAAVYAADAAVRAARQRQADAWLRICEGEKA